MNSHGYAFGNKPYLGNENNGTRFPKSILHASRNFSAQQTVHPTQKPTNILNWLIMTYSNPGDTIMDFTMGSGGTGVSAKMTGRNFIGIERDSKYFNISKIRIDQVSENIVSISDKQLSTQLPDEVQTTPTEKHEQGVLESIRDPEKAKSKLENKGKKSKKQKLLINNSLFEE
jgi:hypothetical protein